MVRLSSADDVGRHYLIAVAAAAQYAIYPVWAGLSLTLGFPDKATTLTRCPHAVDNTDEGLPWAGTSGNIRG